MIQDSNTSLTPKMTMFLRLCIMGLYLWLFQYLEGQYYVFCFVFSWGPNMRTHTWLELIKYSFVSLEYRPNSPTREFTSFHKIQWWERAQRDLILFQRIYIWHYIIIYYNHGLFAKGRLCSNLSEPSAFPLCSGM